MHNNWLTLAWTLRLGIAHWNWAFGIEHSALSIYSSVTHPSEADLTSRTYFASTPLVAF